MSTSPHPLPSLQVHSLRSDSEVVATRPLSSLPFQEYAAPSTVQNTNTSEPMSRPDRELLPFLGLKARIWLAAFNPAFLPLVFTIAHIAATRSSTGELAARLKRSVLDACGQLADGAGALQALPRVLAMQTNAQALRATLASVRGVGSVLIDCITVIEVVVNFIVDTYRSFLMCMLQLAVQGSLELLISAVQTITNGVNSALNVIHSNIQNDISAANKVIQGAINGVNGAIGFVTGSKPIPDFSIPSLSQLNSVQIPTTFEDSLIKLNASMPTLDQLREKVEQLIDVPFGALKTKINASTTDIVRNLNESSFPVPSLRSLAAAHSDKIEDTLCDDLDLSFIDNTARALHKLGTIAIALMCVAILVAWGVLAFYQWQRWRALRDTVYIVEGEWAARSSEPRDVWSVIAIVESPLVERFARPVMDRFRMQPRTRSNVRWMLSYMSHPTCVTLLVMSVVGLVAIQLQIMALRGIKAAAQESARSSVNEITGDIAARLNALTEGASGEYARSMNATLARIEDQVNNELFGEWVKTTSVGLNATLVEFYSDVEDVLRTAFGGTPLFNPVNNFVFCILGSKIVSLEKALTWVSEHAHISLPGVPDDVLQLSNSSMSELATPVTKAAVGSGGVDGTNGTEADDGAIGQLVAHFERALRAELAVYAMLLGVWGAVMLAGLVVVVWHSGGREKYARWRARRRARHPGPGKSFTPAIAPSATSSTAHLQPVVYDTYTARGEKGAESEEILSERGVPAGPGSMPGSLRADATTASRFVSLGGWLKTTDEAPGTSPAQPAPPRPPRSAASRSNVRDDANSDEGDGGAGVRAFWAKRWSVLSGNGGSDGRGARLGAAQRQQWEDKQRSRNNPFKGHDSETGSVTPSASASVSCASPGRKLVPRPSREHLPRHRADEVDALGTLNGTSPSRSRRAHSPLRSDLDYDCDYDYDYDNGRYGPDFDRRAGSPVPSSSLAPECQRSNADVERWRR